MTAARPGTLEDVTTDPPAVPLVDRLIGTDLDPRDVDKSPTVRTLGVDR